MTNVLPQNRWIMQEISERFAEARPDRDIMNSYVAGKLLIGIPIPALSLRYLLQSTVYPTGRWADILGPTGSGKSALLHELIRWHAIYGGGGATIETENKETVGLQNAIFHHDPRLLASSYLVPAYSLDDQQDAITTFLKIFRDREDESNYSAPVMLGVDSLTAASPEERIQKVMDDGHGGRAHPIMALMIADHFRSLASQMAGYPISIAATNHIRVSKDDRGHTVTTIPGGQIVGYLESFQLRCTKLRDIAVQAYHGIQVAIKCSKCGVGETGKEIIANLLWWFVPGPDGNTQQLAVWDWHTASISMLLNTDKLSATLRSAISQVCDLHVVASNLVWSRALRIPESDPVPWAHAGVMLEQRPDLLKDLHVLLGILPHYHISPDVKYKDQYLSLKHTLEREFRDALHASARVAKVEGPPADAPPVVDKLKGKKKAAPVLPETA